MVYELPESAFDDGEIPKSIVDKFESSSEQELSITKNVSTHKDWICDVIIFISVYWFHYLFIGHNYL